MYGEGTYGDMTYGGDEDFFILSPILYLPAIDLRDVYLPSTDTRDVALRAWDTED